MDPTEPAAEVSPGAILREWGRLGCWGLGGPPVHIAMLREACVERRRWIEPAEFEDAIAVGTIIAGAWLVVVLLACGGFEVLRRGFVPTLLAAALAGLVVVAVGAPLPSPTLGLWPPLRTCVPGTRRGPGTLRPRS